MILKLPVSQNIFKVKSLIIKTSFKEWSGALFKQLKTIFNILKNPGNQANEKYFGLQVQLKVHGFNNLTHSRFTNIVGFYNGLVDNKHLCWVSCQEHLLTSLLMQLHHGHNMLTDNSQSLLYGGSRISLRALLLFVSGFLYVINSAPAHWQTSRV